MTTTLDILNTPAHDTPPDVFIMVRLDSHGFVSSMLWQARRLSCWSMVFLLSLPGVAARGQSSVDFAKDIWPILRRDCVECHGPLRAEGDLRLDGPQAIRERKEIVIAGDTAAGELLRRIQLPASDKQAMPSNGRSLTPAQIDLIKRWIAAGAEWPQESIETKHWAYVVPRRPMVPPTSTSGASAIDAFVEQKLHERGVHFSQPASAEKLVRRLFLDLIGLPPSIDEINRFAADPTEDNYRKLVDELLDRPQFGEKWARGWLDAARYADSHGFQKDNLRDMWAYRDWVIGALNADMPFDQFTIEQIAGDLLPEATISQRIATGFHRCAPTNVEAGSIPEETRVEQVIDRVNTTASVWLGSTLECCQCHDHKYDPFTQKEYYQLLKFFNNTQQEADRTNPKTPSSIEFTGAALELPDPESDRARKSLTTKMKAIDKQLTDRRQQLIDELPQWSDELRPRLASHAAMHPLQVESFASRGTTDTVERLPDGAILLRGDDPPETDVYEVRCRNQIEGVRAIRLDVLRHAELPGMGPGRGDRVRRNFVLNDLRAELVNPTTDARQILKFVSAQASFSQKNFVVAGAIDDDPKTGWAISPEFSRSHWAIFVLEQPIDIEPDYELRLTLTQNFGQSRTIGCFRLSALTGEVDSTSVPDAIVQVVNKAIASWSEPERNQLIDYRIEQDDRSQTLKRRKDQLQEELSAISMPTTQVMVELTTPRPTHIFERGDYRKPGELVRPGTPAVLHPMEENASRTAPPTSASPNRLQLARWLASRDNPLVARVTVNRWWAEIFGTGLVSTPEDFGIKGELPSHPELLDWLACELVDNGWSMKSLIRTIVISNTYRQSSSITPELRQADPMNTWLARGPSFRMDAEMIRDNALSIAGLISLKQGGPAVRPAQPSGIWKKVGGIAYNYEVSTGGDQYRRGIYVVLKRGTPYPSFINFDSTARLACSLKRNRTNTPVQALTLLNDPVYVEAAEALAARVVRELPNANIEQRMSAMFQLATGRQPNQDELAVLREYCLPPTNDSTQASTDSADMLMLKGLATVIMNLHETISKD